MTRTTAKARVPVEHVVDGGAHDVVDALQVVVELLHVVRGVRV